LNDPDVTLPAPWKIVIVSQAPPAAFAIDAMCREAGHQPVAIITSRRIRNEGNLPAMLDGAAADVDVLYAAHKRSLAPLFRAYEPNLVICLGFPWLIPQEALDIPKLGAINVHPSKLPLYRGPIPLPWAVRNGETEIAMTVHRMDATYDTGAILAQAPVPVDPAAWTFEEVIPHFQSAMRQIIPRALERIAAGDEGEPQEGDPGVYAGWFETSSSRSTGASRRARSTIRCARGRSPASSATRTCRSARSTASYARSSGRASSRLRGRGSRPATADLGYGVGADLGGSARARRIRYTAASNGATNNTPTRRRSHTLPVSGVSEPQTTKYSVC
jgi:methionyl-tRNA formyltransferase